MKIALVIFITLALAGCALLSLHMGVIPVPWRALLTDWQDGREHYYVLMEYRLPRLLLALFVGAALAVAGVLVQGIVRNPLASPDILGINHAASLASVGALLLMPSLSVMVLPLLAFAGGMAGLILLKMLAKTHPADEAGAHRRGAFRLLGEPDGLPDAPAPAGCKQCPAVADG
ncbi:iron(III) dicitrate transport system permease protein FecD [Klebsiella pneumoniae]|nr:iron(III) dicitrate transport system permease protein FecD [Klebsiella pneumoniae]